MKQYLIGTVSGGRVQWDSPALTIGVFKSFEGKKVRVTVEKFSAKRTSPQNAYFHGVVLPMIHAALVTDLGWDFWDIDDTKNHLKKAFLKQELVDKNGEIFEKIPSTASLTKEEFMIFLDKCIQFAAEHLHLVVPSPGETYDRHRLISAL